MSESGIDVLRDQFAAVNERDFPRAMGHYAEDVVLIITHAGGVKGKELLESQELQRQLREAKTKEGKESGPPSP